MKEDNIYDMTHDAWVCAFHEAGHAVLIVAVGWGPKVEEVVITQETAHGGYVRLNDHKGRLTPKDEILRELAKNLAGPTAQVLFLKSCRYGSLIV
jgi:ATP-dependent Zn protease